MTRDKGQEIGEGGGAVWDGSFPEPYIAAADVKIW